MGKCYDRELVVCLLPTVWDRGYAYGLADPYVPDPDMPKARADPKKSGALLAHLADVRTAWARTPLDVPHRQALLLAYGAGWKQREIAAVQKVARSTVSTRLAEGVGRLVDTLNGRTELT